MHININNKYLFSDYYKVKCAVGKRGIKIKKREGDLITPKGIFKIKYLLYRNDRILHSFYLTKYQLRSSYGDPFYDRFPPRIRNERIRNEQN